LATSWIRRQTWAIDQYRLDVQIVTWRSSDAVKVPLAALFRCAEQWCTFVVDGGRAAGPHANRTPS
jgi:hypothetical protein